MRSLIDFFSKKMTTLTRGWQLSCKTCASSRTITTKNLTISYRPAHSQHHSVVYGARCKPLSFGELCPRDCDVTLRKGHRRTCDSMTLTQFYEVLQLHVYSCIVHTTNPPYRPYRERHYHDFVKQNNPRFHRKRKRWIHVSCVPVNTRPRKTPGHAH